MSDAGEQQVVKTEASPSVREQLFAKAAAQLVEASFAYGDELQEKLVELLSLMRGIAGLEGLMFELIEAQAKSRRYARR